MEGGGSTREILTHVADHSLEDEEKRKMVLHHHHKFTADLSYLIETRDVEEVSGDQAEFIEIVLNAELGGSLPKRVPIPINLLRSSISKRKLDCLKRLSQKEFRVKQWIHT